MKLPEEEGDVAVLALPALHGAVQGQAGVPEGEVVQLAVHVVGVALEALEAAERRRCGKHQLVHTEGAEEKGDRWGFFLINCEAI